MYVQYIEIIELNNFNVRTFYFIELNNFNERTFNFNKD